jgi:hypothetical protein
VEWLKVKALSSSPSTTKKKECLPSMHKTLGSIPSTVKKIYKQTIKTTKALPGLGKDRRRNHF